MVVAGGIKVGAFGGKPQDLLKIVELLTEGSKPPRVAASDKSDEDSEYAEDWSWGSNGDEDDEEEQLAGGRWGDDT
jgi:hypothetical protein